MRKVWILLLGLAFWGCQPAPPEKLTLAVAANMQFAIREITDAFTEQTGIPCEVIVGSSGKLTAQIREGAPFDLFLSADTRYPQTLYDLGLATEPLIYARGRLVLWTASKAITPDIEQLLSEGVTHIAMANPKTAPYGRAALEVLQALGLDEAVRPKLVYGESISQTNQFIRSGTASLGFTAKSVVLSPQVKEVGRWSDIDPSHYAPIEQALVILKTERSPEARRFRDFLLSGTGKKIFHKFGYLVDE